VSAISWNPSPSPPPIVSTQTPSPPLKAQLRRSKRPVSADRSRIFGQMDPYSGSRTPAFRAGWFTESYPGRLANKSAARHVPIRLTAPTLAADNHRMSEERDLALDLVQTPAAPLSSSNGLKTPTGEGDLATRGQRFAAKTLALALVVELGVIGYFGGLGLVRLSEGVPLRTEQMLGVGDPGVQLHTNFDLVRGVGFFVAIIASGLILVIAAWSLTRRMPKRSRISSRVKRLCVVAAMAGNVIACLIALIVYPGSVTDPNTLYTLKIAYGLGALFAVEALLGAFVIRRSSQRGGLILGGVIAVVLSGVLVSTQEVNMTSYQGWAPLSNNGPAVLAATDQGFLIPTTTQEPASGAAFQVACANSADCLLFGNGYTQGGQTKAEVTVTSDGGKSWRSWFFPSSLLATSSVSPACQGSTCIGTALDGSSPGFAVFHVTVLSDGRVAESLSPGNPSWTLGSCATSGWCAGIDKGDFNFTTRTLLTPPALLTTTNGGTTWTTIPFPTPLVPAGDEVSGSLTCPVVAHCVLEATLNLQGVTTTADRAAARSGSSFLVATDDGGRTWTQAMLPVGTTSTSDLQCTDAEHCFAIGYSGETGKFLGSNTGGLAWTLFPTLLPHPVFGGHLVCSDATHCLVFGASKRSLAPTPTALLSTADAGRSWTTDSLPHERNGQVLTVISAACPTSADCVASAKVQSQNSYQPVVLTSHNGGRSWSQGPMPKPKALP
jgi:photosystem II stability/assembly factor-like uncharacterized protein